MNTNEDTGLKRFSTIQLLNFCLGFFGLQFAWQMRIILSGPVTEGLGASPLLFGLIWLAGPVTGMVVQPLIGAMSDNTHSKFGRRRPYILAGALLASVALLLLPESAPIIAKLQSLLPFELPKLTALVFAAAMIWIIDACVNAAQGPYRAIIPDNIPKDQHAVANSYLSFAIGLGSVIAAGTAPVLSKCFGYTMSIGAQFAMAAIAFSGATIWTCLTLKERDNSKDVAATAENTDDTPFLQKMKDFFSTSPEVAKICTMQLFTWVGIMSMFIFFTQFSVHTVFQIPDLTGVGETVKKLYDAKVVTATNFSSICFAVFNLVCFLVSLPLGLIASKYGNKNIHSISLAITAVAFGAMTFVYDKTAVLALMAIAGIGWASTLAMPFAMLSEFIKKGSEGSVMGIFNIFIAGPQVLVCTLLAWFINQCSFETVGGINYHWEYALAAGAVTLLIAAVISQTIKEGK